MPEVGIDLSSTKPQKLTQELADAAALLVTMGCGDKCPYVSGSRRDDWPLRDPSWKALYFVSNVNGYEKTAEPPIARDDTKRTPGGRLCRDQRDDWFASDVLP
jgi:hypothetical protein